MKTNMMIVVALMAALLVQGQASFVKAYIVTDKGDTLKGEGKINPKKESEAYDKVYFKDANGVQKTYKPHKILAYGINDEHFISLDHDGEPKFYKVLARGDINLYMVVFEALQMNQVSLDAEYYIARPDNKKLVVVKQNKFKKQLADWMKDNPEILDSYTEEKKFDPEKAVAVITQYNSWKAGSNQQ